MDRGGRTFMKKLELNYPTAFADIHDAKGYGAFISECPIYYAEEPHFHLAYIRRRNLADYIPKMRMVDEFFKSSPVNSESFDIEEHMETYFAPNVSKSLLRSPCGVKCNEEIDSLSLSTPIDGSPLSSEVNNKSSLSEDLHRKKSKSYASEQGEISHAAEGFVKSIIKKLHLWYNGISTLRSDTSEIYGGEQGIGLKSSSSTKYRPVKSSLAERWNSGSRNLNVLTRNYLVRHKNPGIIKNLLNMYIMGISTYIDEIVNKNMLFKKHHIWTYHYSDIMMLLEVMSTSEDLRTYILDFLGLAIESQFRMIESAIVETPEYTQRCCTLSESVESNVQTIRVNSVAYGSKSDSRGCNIRILTLESFILALIYGSEKARQRNSDYPNILSRISETRCRFVDSHSSSKPVCNSRKFLAKLLISPETSHIDDTIIEPARATPNLPSIKENFQYSQPSSLENVLLQSIEENSCFEKLDYECLPLIGATLRKRRFNLKKNFSRMRRYRRGYNQLKYTYGRLVQRIENLYKRIKQKTLSIRNITAKRIKSYLSHVSLPTLKRFTGSEYHLYISDSYSDTPNRHTNVMRTCSPKSAKLLRSEVGYQANTNDFFEVIAIPKSPSTGIFSSLLRNIPDLNDCYEDEKDEDIIIVEGPNERDRIVRPEVHSNIGHRIEIISVSNVCNNNNNESKVYRKLADSGIFDCGMENKSIFKRACPKFLRRMKKDKAFFKLKDAAEFYGGLDRTSFDNISDRGHDSIYSEYISKSDEHIDASSQNEGNKHKWNKVCPGKIPSEYERIANSYNKGYESPTPSFKCNQLTQLTPDYPLPTGRVVEARRSSLSDKSPCINTVNQASNISHNKHKYSPKGLTREYLKMRSYNTNLSKKLSDSSMKTHGKYTQVSDQRASPTSELQPYLSNNYIIEQEKKPVLTLMSISHSPREKDDTDNLYRGLSSGKSLINYKCSSPYTPAKNLSFNHDYKPRDKCRSSECRSLGSLEDLQIKTNLIPSDNVKGIRSSYYCGDKAWRGAVLNPALHLVSSGSSNSSLLSNLFTKQDTGSRL